jgi:hypothetical protein
VATDVGSEGVPDADQLGQLGLMPRVRLSKEVATSAPRTSGLYAAWAVVPPTLEELGVDARAPLCMYIGKAGGSSGLRHRLGRHARTPWWRVLDLLASQSRGLPGWWQYAPKWHGRRSDVPSALAVSARIAALEWQQDHFRWGWVDVREAELRSLESQLIARYQPFLNLQGQGLKGLGPPQLRAVGRYAPQRAAWLFRVAWIAVLTQRPKVGHGEGLQAYGWRVTATGGRRRSLPGTDTCS